MSLDVVLEQAVLHAGDTLRGYMTMRLGEEWYMRSINLTFSGEEYTYWTERYTSTDSKGRSTTHTRTHTETKTLLSEQIVFMAAPTSKGEAMQAGVYKYPFVIKLPVGLLPSYRSGPGTICYRVKGLCEVAHMFSFNLRCKKPIVILESVPPLSSQQFQRLTSRAMVQDQKTFMLASGAVDLTFSIDRTLVCAGDQVPVSVVIRNGSSKPVNGIEFQMRVYELWLAGSSSKDRGQKWLAVRVDTPVAPNTENTIGMVLHIPENTPSTIEGIIIKRQVIVRAKLMFSMATDKRVDIPLLVVAAEGRAHSQVVAQRPSVQYQELHTALGSLCIPLAEGFRVGPNGEQIPIEPITTALVKSVAYQPMEPAVQSLPAPSAPPSAAPTELRGGGWSNITVGGNPFDPSQLSIAPPEEYQPAAFEGPPDSEQQQPPNGAQPLVYDAAFQPGTMPPSAAVGQGASHGEAPPMPAIGYEVEQAGSATHVEHMSLEGPQPPPYHTMYRTAEVEGCTVAEVDGKAFYVNHLLRDTLWSFDRIRNAHDLKEMGKPPPYPAVQSVSILPPGWEWTVDRCARPIAVDHVRRCTFWNGPGTLNIIVSAVSHMEQYEKYDGMEPEAAMPDKAEMKSRKFKDAGARAESAAGGHDTRVYVRCSFGETELLRAPVTFPIESFPRASATASLGGLSKPVTVELCHGQRVFGVAWVNLCDLVHQKEEWVELHAVDHAVVNIAAGADVTSEKLSALEAEFEDEWVDIRPRATGKIRVFLEYTFEDLT